MKPILVENWSIYELLNSQRILTGYNSETQMVIVTAPIMSYDENTRTFKTFRGDEYQLLGDSSLSLDAWSVFSQKYHGEDFFDVSIRY